MNPYPGLRPYRHKEKLYGRDERVDELIWLLKSERFVAVTGVSGSGKSSLVRAGLVDALVCGRMPIEQNRWKFAILTPGANPLKNLHKALVDCAALTANEDSTELQRGGTALVELIQRAVDGAAPNSFALLLVVDQFEELFLYARENPREVAIFLDLLLAADGQRTLPFFLVITMRSDFIGEAARFRGLPELLNRSNYLVPRMTRRDMTEAIVEPAQAEKVTICPRLVNRLLNETGEDPSRLPLLQHALHRTWEQWEKEGAQGEIDGKHYETIGTIDGIDGKPGALHLHAQAVYDDLSKEQQGLCERLFLGVTECSPEGRVAKCAKTLESLEKLIFATIHDDPHWAPTAEQKSKLSEIIGCFRTNSFLRSTEDQLDASYVDLSHESLIAGWRTLRHWIDEETQRVADWKWLVEMERRNEKGNGGLLYGKQITTGNSLVRSPNFNHFWVASLSPHSAGQELLKRVIKFIEISETNEAEEKEATRLAKQKDETFSRMVRYGVVFATVSILGLLAGATYIINEKNVRLKGAYSDVVLLNQSVNEAYKELKYTNQQLSLQKEQEEARAGSARERSTALLKEAQAMIDNPNGKEATQALRMLGYALRLDPGNVGAIKLACSLLATKNWCVPASPVFGQKREFGSPLSATFGPTNEVFVVFSNGALCTGNEATGKLEFLQFLLPTEKTALLKPAPNINPKRIQRATGDLAGTSEGSPSLISATFTDDAKSLVVFHVPLASSSEPPTCQVWTWIDGKYVEKGHSLNLRDRSPFKNVQWSKDGYTFFVGRWDVSSCQVFHWEYNNFDWEKPSSLQKAISDESISAAGFSSKHMATVSFSASGGNSPVRLRLRETASFDPDQGASIDRKQARNGKNEMNVLLPFNTRPTQLVFSSSGGEIVLSSFGLLPKLVRLVGSGDLEEPSFGSVGANDIPMRVIFSPPNERGDLVNSIAAAAFTNRVELLDCKQLSSRVFEPIHPKGSVVFPVFGREEPKLVTLSGSSWLGLETVRTWDLTSRPRAEFDLELIKENEIAPRWLADLALIVSGQGGSSEIGESNGGTSDLLIRTLKELSDTYGEELGGTKYAAIWRRFVAPMKKPASFSSQ